MIKNKTFIKQFLYYFVIFALILSITGIIIYTAAKRIIEDEAEKMYTAMINGVKSNIDSRFDELNNLKLQIGNNRMFCKIMNMYPSIDMNRLSVIDFLEMQETLFTYRTVNNFIDEIMVYCLNGKIVFTPTFKEDAEYFFTNSYKIENSDIFNLDILNSKIGTNELIPDVKIDYFGRTSNVMLYVQSIIPYSGKSNALLIIMIKKSTIETILNNYCKNNDYGIAIIDKNNNIIASNNNIILQDNINEIISKNKDDRSVDRIGINGQEYVVYNVSASNNDWKYIAVTSLNAITNKVDIFQKMFFIVFSIAIVFGFSLLIYITNVTLNPLKRIIMLFSGTNAAQDKKHKSEFEIIENCISDLQYENNLMHTEVEEYSFIKRERYLYQFICGKVEYSNDTFEVLSKFGICFSYELYRVVLIEVQPKDEDNINNNNIILGCIMDMKDLLEKNFSGGHFLIYMIITETNAIVALLNIDKEAPYNVYTGQIKEKLRDIKQIIEDGSEVIVTIGIGNEYNTLDGIKASYSDAKQAITYKLLMGSGSIMDYSEINSNEGHYYYYPLDKELSLIEGLKSADYAKIENVIDEIIKKNLYLNQPEINMARFLFFDLQATALKAIQEVNLNNDNCKIITNELSSIKTFNEMIDYIKKIYYHICQDISNKKESVSDSLIHNILRYIDENICNHNFSLNLCSLKYGLSDSSFSRFFREKTGQYFTDYINRKRIEMSKEILKSEKYTIKDIGVSVGFINDVTFRRVFKKYQLITPAEYRKQLNSIPDR